MGQKQEECLFLKVKGKRANQEGMEGLGMGKTKQSAVDVSLKGSYPNTT